MKNYISSGLLLFLVFAAGCAVTPQAPIAIQDGVWQQNGMKVGVLMSEVPELNVYLPGADCLLCIAAAEVANKSLSNHVDTLSHDNLPAMADQVVGILRQRGVPVLAYGSVYKPADLPTTKTNDNVSNAARKDFSSYRGDSGLSHLLVIDVYMLGMYRPYAAYIPSSDPQAVFKGAAYLVNLADNTYDWYKPIEIFRNADGEWDEPPQFPALTNAYYQTLEIGRSEILAAVSQ